MSKHERSFRRQCVCSDCDGIGTIEVGKRGPNDPDVYEVECPECGGSGEVYVEPVEADDDEDDA